MADAPGRPGQPREFSILIVCTANRCRSALAEQLLRAALESTGADPRRTVSVASAGVRAVNGMEMESLAAAELRRLGGDPAGFRSRQLTPADSDSAHLILTATVDHRGDVLAESPHALRRTFTLLEFAHLVTEVESVHGCRGSPEELVHAASTARGSARLPTYDIQDPVGCSRHVHRHVADVVAASVHVIAHTLTGR